LIISNWNKVVSKRDTTYILGDIAMENDKNYYQLDRLNGRKIIVGGNHDSPKHIKKLMEYCDYFAGCVDYKGCILTHIPIHESCIWECRFNVFGHIHGLTIDHPKYINVCCEQPYINYTPIEFQVLINMFKIDGN